MKSINIDGVDYYFANQIRIILKKDQNWNEIHQYWCMIS
jgi:hypothetical protein